MSMSPLARCLPFPTQAIFVMDILVVILTFSYASEGFYFQDSLFDGNFLRIIA
jgi:hypothetical protein